MRAFTPARIGLSRSGASLGTQPSLEFRLAHARARDAVYDSLDDARLSAEAAAHVQPILVVNSATDDRRAYLMRPDLGRRLGPEAPKTLAPFAGTYD
ncbi:MAG: ethanolamine ammonia-lyase light chain EutC, partial [Acetobacteraceae bacterium]